MNAHTSSITANDQATLEAVGRNPGVKRKHWTVNAAATVRLIRAGLVAAPTTNGRLYLTEAGAEAYWQPAPRTAPLPSVVMQRMSPAEVALKAPYAVTRTMLANGYAGYEDGVEEPQPCGLNGCDCHLVTPAPARPAV